MPQSSRKSQKLWLAGWLLHAVGTWMHHLPTLLQPCPHRQLAAALRKEAGEHLISRPKKTNDNYWRLEEMLVVSAD